MGLEINQKLRTAAEASALKKSATPLFVCDENWRLCMFSIGFTSVIPHPVIDKDMSVILSPEALSDIQSMPDGCMPVMLDLPQYKNSALAVVGHFEDARYTVIVLDGKTKIHNFAEKAYIAQADLRFAQVIDELLRQPSADQTKLSISCDQLNRLRKYAQFSTHSQTDPDLYTNAATELTPYIQTLASEFNSKLASIGCTVSFTKSSSHVYFCDCPPMILGAVLSTLISAAVCLSADGDIVLTCNNMVNDFRSAYVSIDTVNPLHSTLSDNFDQLMEHLSVLKLDLLAIKDLAKRYRIDLDCQLGPDGIYRIGLHIPYTHAGKVAFHAPAHSVETVFTTILVDQLSVLIRNVWKTAHDTNIHK